MKKRSAVLTGVAAAGLLTWVGFSATAESPPPPPREAVFDDISACGPDEEVLHAIADVGHPGDAASSGTAVEALRSFLARTYPGALDAPREVLLDGGDLTRIAVSSARGVELLVDVAPSDKGPAVTGWTGCNSYLTEVRQGAGDE